MTEAYKIGVTVAMTNLVSAELGKITTSLFSAEKQAKNLALSLGTLSKIGIGAGFVAAFAVLGAGVEEARKFQIEATKFAALGFGDAVNSQAKQFAEGMHTLGTSATENMALVSDAMAVFKDIGHAEMAAPLMAKMKFANAAIYGPDGGEHDKKFMDMLKVIEFRGGLSSDAEFSTQADYVQKVINGSRNRVDATQLLMALKTGGVALSRLSNQGFYLGSEPLIQEFGGSRYGTANMSAYQNLVMMRTTQQALTEMMRLGILDNSKVEMNKFTGKVKRASAGAFRGANVLEEEGDLAFLQKVLLPAFAKKGITSDDEIITEIGRLFTNRTASGLFARVYQQRATLQKQMDANKNAMGINALTGAADQTLDGKIAELSAQWKTLMNQMGVLLPVITKMTGWLVSFIKALQLDGSAAQKIGGFVNGAIDSAGNMLGSIENAGRSVGNAFYGRNSVPPPSASPNNGTIKTTINIDGRAIATTVSKYQIDGLQTVPRSGSLFDSSQHLQPVQ